VRKKAKKGSKKGAKKAKTSNKSNKRGRKPKKAAKEASEEDDKLYCCEEPYDKAQEYVGCSNEAKCVGVEWYHQQCVGIKNSQAKRIKEWFCDACKYEDEHEQDEQEE